jgi:hypothetical protein
MTTWASLRATRPRARRCARAYSHWPAAAWESRVRADGPARARPPSPSTARVDDDDARPPLRRRRRDDDGGEGGRRRPGNADRAPHGGPSFRTFLWAAPPLPPPADAPDVAAALPRPDHP